MDYKKQQLINGVFWSGLDKLGVIVLQLLLEIVLARFLLPRDYGVIGMASIFIALGSLFSESGFSNALIQKQDRSEQDFSTAFYFNLLVSIVFVVLIFISAPFIANFFETPILTNVLRILSISVIFNAIVMVHKTKLSISLDFKTQARVSFISLLLSGIISLILVLNGFGVWGLVTQILLQSFFNALLFQISLKWKPLLCFSKESFKNLINFGGKILLAGILQSAYVNTYNLLIGKKFSASTLGIYTKSNQFTTMPSTLFSGILQRVMFPYFSSFQHDNEKIYRLNQDFTNLVCIVVFPVFLFLALFAKPLVFYGLSVEWIAAAEVIKVLALSVILLPLIINNMILFQVKNKASIFLVLEILTKLTGGIILILTINHGLLAICYGLLVQQILQFLITSISVQILLQKNILNQIKIIFPYYIIGGLIYILINYLDKIIGQKLLIFFISGVGIFTIYYAFVYFVFFRSKIAIILNLIKNK